MVPQSVSIYMLHYMQGAGFTVCLYKMSLKGILMLTHNTIWYQQLLDDGVLY